MNFRSLWLFAAVFLAGCPNSKIEGVDVSAARAFYAQPMTEQMKTFRNHSLEEQLALYFYGNQVRHPPAIYLARCFALNGANAVEILRTKLKSKNDDLTVRDISSLLEAVDALGRYDVSEDLQLMSALRSSVRSMQDQGWRDTAQNKVISIENSQVVPVGNASECGSSQ